VVKKYVSLKEVLQKIKAFCAYQERCHLEVKGKLFDFGLSVNEVDEIVAVLIEEDYLNEERFAILFAGGKFRIKQWGRVKIRYELKSKQISAINIKKALAQIDEDDYLKTLTKQYETYFGKQKGIQQIKKVKTLKYLQTKGFEMELIIDVTKNINLNSL
jgi:regulatory protein